MTTNIDLDALQALAPCPFCDGRDPELADSAVPSALTGMQKRAVYCNDCFCEGPTADTDADAIAAWNRRAGASADAKDAAPFVDVEDEKETS